MKKNAIVSLADSNYFELLNELVEIMFGSKPKRKRARNKDGTFKADNKDTKGKNEAWEVE